MSDQTRPSRWIRATDVLNGSWNPNQFPFRYVAIWHGKEIVNSARGHQVDTVLSAVELLEQQGWELVNVDESVTIACLRRLAAPQPGQL